jgi:hypothetical protein
MIEQRCKKIQQQLQQATNAVQSFEEQILLKFARHIDYSQGEKYGIRFHRIP